MSLEEGGVPEKSPVARCPQCKQVAKTRNLDLLKKYSIDSYGYFSIPCFEFDRVCSAELKALKDEGRSDLGFTCAVREIAKGSGGFFKLGSPRKGTRKRKGKKSR